MADSVKYSCPCNFGSHICSVTFLTAGGISTNRLGSALLKSKNFIVYPVILLLATISNSSTDTNKLDADYFQSAQCTISNIAPFHVFIDQ